MKKLFLFPVLFVALSFVVVACGGEAPKASDDTKAPEQEKVESEIPAADEKLEADASMDLSAGKAVYEAMCQVCHQVNGEGAPPNFPPLAKADYLLADIPRAIRQARNGSNEPITVNGVEYTMQMAPVALTDQELLDVMNYVLNSWGNEHGMIAMEDVTAAFAE